MLYIHIISLFSNFCMRHSVLYTQTFLDNPCNLHPVTIAEEVFNEMDLNRDNEIAYNEFMATCLDNEKMLSMLTTKILEFAASDCI